ncbi:MAG: type II toxin-antitoxin system HipA family toxin [Gemmatimonadetes bacterium]|nr:type II toxin-antitoxin system HipA family toxin [Gemmatimonadota bacterium]
MSAPDALVYVDLDGNASLAGRLWTHVKGSSRSASFEYDASWIGAAGHFALEPALRVGPGPFHTAPGRALFNAIGDSAPDRWGRTLLARRERLEAKRAGRAPRTLLEIDYLLGLSDFTRQGALRFKREEDGPFLAEGGEHVPPFIELGRLMAAAERVSGDEETEEDLRLLLAPGSSLLGSRPKASVRSESGGLMIAKFNRVDDDHDVGRWEGIAMKLAGMAGLNVAPWMVEGVSGRTVFLTHRFDRLDEIRVPFLSAMSMLEAVDGQHRSYMEIADAVRMHSASATEDLQELWRRVVFTVLISNTDDHLRNHGFLYAGEQGWRLSPAYDVNPVPTDVGPRVLSTAIVEGNDRSASIDLAFDAAPHFGLEDHEARGIAEEVARAAAQWRKVARGLSASEAECDRMASAFEHEDLASLTRDRPARLSPTRSP